MGGTAAQDCEEQQPRLGGVHIHDRVHNVKLQHRCPLESCHWGALSLATSLEEVTQRQLVKKTAASWDACRERQHIQTLQCFDLIVTPL